MTTLEKQRSTMATIQEMVIRSSKVNMMDYNEFQYSLGTNVLNAHIVAEEMIDKLMRDKTYWSWFRVRYLEHELVVIEYLNQKKDFNWREYTRLMQEVVESKRTVLALHHFLTLFKHIR